MITISEHIDVNEQNVENTEKRQLTGKERRLANLVPFKRGSGEDRDPRINIHGAPRKKHSISEQFALAVEMTVGDVLRIVGKKSKLGKKLSTFPTDMQMKQVIAIMNTLDAALNPNQARVLNLITDRLEGKVNDKGLDADGEASQSKRISIPADMISPSFFESYRAVLSNEYDEFVEKGGRGSTKSTFISLIIVMLIVNNPDFHALILRQTQESLRDSVFAQMKWAINQLGLTDQFKATVSPMQVEYIPTGQMIFFRGADDPMKVRSVKPEFGKLAIVWFEELPQFHGENVVRDIIQSAVRGEGADNSYIFYSYNPPRTKANWVNKWVDTPAPRRWVHSSSYMDVPKQWLGQVFIRIAEALKLSNPDAYANEYEGVVNGFGNLVFTNIEQRTITDDEIKNFDNVLNGLDFGYIHPAHYSKVHFDVERLELYIFGELRKYKTSNKELYEAMVESGYRPQDLLIADSAEPKSISELANYGAYVMGATKGVDSVKYSIKWLQSLRKIVIDPSRCPYSNQEFTNFSYLMTKDGEVIEAFPDVDDDSIASVRYATNTYWIRAGQ